MLKFQYVTGYPEMLGATNIGTCANENAIRTAIPDPFGENAER